MRSARSLAASLLLALALVSVATAKDIHVNNVDGDDSFTGRQDRNLSDQSGPVRTIGLSSPTPASRIARASA